MDERVLLITDDRMGAHDAGPQHPERPDRLRAITSDLRARPIEGARWATPRPIDWSILERAHTPRYLEQVEAARDRAVVFDGDTMTCPESVAAAELSAGALIDALDTVIEGRITRAFALGRPPGHHAEADRAMGFCFFSNVAAAALHAIEHHGLERVLVLDWDVHHGNGTQHILEARPEALFVSLHQHPLFPGTGWFTETGEGQGYTVNIPMPAGCADAEHLALMDRIVVPIADAYQPQLVLVSAGFDSHERDPLGEMGVTDAGFGAMLARARGIAERHAAGRLVLALEGGYDLSGLASGVRACVEDLTGRGEWDSYEPPPPTQTAQIIGERVIQAQARRWESVLRST